MLWALASSPRSNQLEGQAWQHATPEALMSVQIKCANELRQLGGPERMKYMTHVSTDSSDQTDNLLTNSAFAFISTVNGSISMCLCSRTWYLCFMTAPNTWASIAPMMPQKMCASPHFALICLLVNGRSSCGFLLILCQRLCCALPASSMFCACSAVPEEESDPCVGLRD